MKICQRCGKEIEDGEYIIEVYGVTETACVHQKSADARVIHSPILAQEFAKDLVTRPRIDFGWQWLPDREPLFSDGWIEAELKKDDK